MKSYISRKFPLQTRTTDQILVRRSEGLGMGFHCGKDMLFPSPEVKASGIARAGCGTYHVGRKASAFLGRGSKAPLSFPCKLLYISSVRAIYGRAAQK